MNPNTNKECGDAAISHCYKYFANEKNCCGALESLHPAENTAAPQLFFFHSTFISRAGHSGNAGKILVSGFTFKVNHG